MNDLKGWWHNTLNTAIEQSPPIDIGYAGFVEFRPPGGGCYRIQCHHVNLLNFRKKMLASFAPVRRSKPRRLPARMSDQAADKMINAWLLGTDPESVSANGRIADAKRGTSSAYTTPAISLTAKVAQKRAVKVAQKRVDHFTLFYEKIRGYAKRNAANLAALRGRPILFGQGKVYGTPYVSTRILTAKDHPIFGEIDAFIGRRRGLFHTKRPNKMKWGNRWFIVEMGTGLELAQAHGTARNVIDDVRSSKFYQDPPQVHKILRNATKTSQQTFATEWFQSMGVEHFDYGEWSASWDPEISQGSDLI